jgi:hypothetical protein
MSQFATHQQLAARLAVTFSDADAARADILLQLASGIVQRAARQILDRVNNDVLVRAGSPDPQIILPQRPVVSVSQVLLDGTPLVFGEPVTQNFNMNASYDFYIINDRIIRPRGWGNEDQALAITYTHGYATQLALIQAVTLECTVRAWINPGNLQQVHFGADREVYGAPGIGGGHTSTGMLLTPDEERVVREAVRRQYASTGMR